MSISGITTATQYLTYTLGSETFALDIVNVREVLDYPNVTLVPNMPDYVLGVINLRGSVVPVVDLRTRFNMPRNDKTLNSCVIISEVHVDGETAILGALADSVQEVVDLEPNQIEAAPKIGTRLRNDFIRGMGKHNDRFIIILDFDRVFSASDVTLAGSLAAESGISPIVQSAA